MKGTERIEAALRASSPALAAFFTAGYPSLEAFGDTLRSIASAADVVEIGVPFSDPMADGGTIQRASHHALLNGVSLQWILDALSAVDVDTPVVLMSYLNPLLAYGLDRLPAAARAAGVCGMIIPDLPLEESGDWAEALSAEGLALVQLVSPVTGEARMGKVAAASTGFLYAVTVTGITGGKSDSEGGVQDYLAHLKAHARVPVMAGFGIRSPEQVSALAPHVDGVIVGTALIEAIERGESPAAFLGHLRPSGSAGTQS